MKRRGKEKEGRREEGKEAAFKRGVRELQVRRDGPVCAASQRRAQSVAQSGVRTARRPPLSPDVLPSLAIRFPRATVDCRCDMIEPLHSQWHYTAKYD